MRNDDRSFVFLCMQDYNSHFKDHAYRFDGSNWFTSLLSRRQNNGDGKDASTAGSIEPGSLDYMVPVDSGVASPTNVVLTSGMQNGAQKSLAEWAIGD